MGKQLDEVAAKGRAAERNFAEQSEALDDAQRRATLAQTTLDKTRSEYIIQIARAVDAQAAAVKIAHEVRVEADAYNELQLKLKVSDATRARLEETIASDDGERAIEAQVAAAKSAGEALANTTVHVEMTRELEESNFERTRLEERLVAYESECAELRSDAVVVSARVVDLEAEAIGAQARADKLSGQLIDAEAEAIGAQARAEKLSGQLIDAETEVIGAQGRADKLGEQLIGAKARLCDVEGGSYDDKREGKDEGYESWSRVGGGSACEGALCTGHAISTAVRVEAGFDEIGELQATACPIRPNARAMCLWNGSQDTTADASAVSASLGASAPAQDPMVDAIISDLKQRMAFAISLRASI